MEIVQCHIKEEVRNQAVGALNTLFSEMQGAVLFLSSGGSALELLGGLHLEETVTVSVLDERYSKDPTVNNFAQLLGNIRPTTFIDTRVRENEILEQLTQRFEKALREWKEQNPKGTIIITQGVGTDGHTAGMMPYPENPELFNKLFDTPDDWVIGYDSRVTVTLSFLRHIVDYSLVYLLGEQKREALKKVLASEGTLWETPGRIVHEMKNVKLFTDIVY